MPPISPKVFIIGPGSTVADMKSHGLQIEIQVVPHQELS